MANCLGKFQSRSSRAAGCFLAAAMAQNKQTQTPTKHRPQTVSSAGATISAWSWQPLGQLPRYASHVALGGTESSIGRNGSKLVTSSPERIPLNSFPFHSNSRRPKTISQTHLMSWPSFGPLLWAAKHPVRRRQLVTGYNKSPNSICFSENDER